MEHLDFLILDLSLILTVASVITILFKKIKQPVVLGYIVAGFVISPNFKWIPTVINSSNISVWANIGVVFLMFAIGLEFNLHKIAEVGRGAIITAATVVITMIVIGYSLGQIMGWSPTDSSFLGCMVSMSSTMIVIKTFDELQLKKKEFAGLVIGALVIEDLLGIFMMIVLTTISVSKSFSGTSLFLQIGKLLLVLILLLVAGIYLIPTVVKRISSLITDEMLLIFSLAFCLVMVVICVLIGFSEALGAFLSGSILAGTKQAERIEHLIKPIKDLFGAVFFVSVGMMIVPSVILEYWWQILVIALVVIIGQMLFSGIGCLLSGQSLYNAVHVGFSMLQVGEFSFILAGLGTSLNVTGDFLYPIIVSVSVITSFLTPMFMKRSDKAYDILNKVLPDKFTDFLEKYTSATKTVSVVDNDWMAYLVHKAKRMVIGISGLLVVLLLFTQALEPAVAEQFSLGPELQQIILALSAIICMIPFVSIMCTKKSMLYMKLWYKSNFNRLPLIAIRSLSIFISLIFIMAIMRRYLLSVPSILQLPIAFCIILYIMRSDFIRSRQLKLETRFYVNFNERIIEHDMNERKSKGDKVWVDEKMLVMEFEIMDNKGREFVKNMISNKAFGCMILSIFRGNNNIINLPKAGTKINNGDILSAVGSEKAIESYLGLLKNDRKVKEPATSPMTLKEYLYSQMFDDAIGKDQQLLCCALKPIVRENPMYRKPIKESGFIAKYGGFILAVEREGLPILSPGRNHVLMENDIIWCIGTQNMVDKLEADNLLMF